MSEHRFAVGETVCMRGSGQVGVVQSRLVNLDTGELVYTVRSEFNYSGPILSEDLLLTMEEQVEIVDKQKEEEVGREEARYVLRNEKRMAARAKKEATNV